MNFPAFLAQATAATPLSVELAPPFKALVQVVLAALLIERGLAFLFEFEWFREWFEKEVDDPDNPGKKRRRAKFPALKGLIAFGASALVCWRYDLDVLAAIFDPAKKDFLGKALTAFVVAGGSAGAIALFQGFLNISKDARDSQIAANEAEAKAQKERAEAERLAAEARKKEAENRLAAARAGGVGPQPQGLHGGGGASGSTFELLSTKIREEQASNDPAITKPLSNYIYTPSTLASRINEQWHFTGNNRFGHSDLPGEKLTGKVVKEIDDRLA